MKITISVLCVLILILPFSEVYTSITEESLAWQNFYIINDTCLLLLYLPFIPLWFGQFIIQNPKWKSIIKLILIALSLSYFLLGAGDLFVPIQDFVPRYGVFISLLYLPLVCYYYWSKNKNS